MAALSVEEFDNLTQDAQWLWRWETQPEYHEPEEAAPFASWKANQPHDLDWLSGWLDHLRTASSAGRKVERVRRLAQPLTMYQQWALTLAPENVQAGEDLRLIEHDEASKLDLPSYDFVIVDDRTVARMRFGPAGFAGADLISDAEEIARHREWRTQAWQHAITVSTYTSRSP